MHRIRFEKTGRAVWMSHLDLMRLMQRAFRRAGVVLHHSQGFTPHAYVSMLLPLSVGMESVCELMEYELDGELALQVDFRKNKDAARLHEMLWTWREQAAKLEAGEISQEEYDRWRYHYPEYDSSQVRAKMPPEGLI